MQTRFFWKLGLTYLLLVCAALLVVDIHSARVLRDDYLRAGFEQLEALMRIAESRPPRLDDVAEVRAWAAWMARSGVRVTVIAFDGRVLADSAHDPATMENHAGRPEIQEALTTGKGRSVRHSETVKQDMLYLAARHQPSEGPPLVLRLASPLSRIEEAQAAIRRRLLANSLVRLLRAGGASRFFSVAFCQGVV